MKQKKYICLVLVLIFFSSCYIGKKSRRDSLLKELRKSPKVEDLYMDSGPGKIKTNKTAQSLIDICSIKTLVKFCSDTSPVVRCYMFYGLIEKNVDEKTILDVFKMHLNDTSKVVLQTDSLAFEINAKLYMAYEIMGYSWALKNRNKNKLLETELRKLKPLEDPFVTVAGVHSGIISKEDFLKSDSLICTSKFCKIISYTLITNNNGELVSYIGSGKALTSEMKKNISELQSGNKVYIEDIKALYIDGTLHTLAPLNLKIK